MAETNPVLLTLISAHGQGRMARPNLYDYPRFLHMDKEEWARPNPLPCPCAEIRVNHTGLVSAILPCLCAEIGDNRTGLCSPILPCPYVEIMDNRLGLDSPILPCPYVDQTRMIIPDFFI
jgi:hypothetical protein